MDDDYTILRRRARIHFWYGWIWGVVFGLAVGLVTHLLEGV